MRSISNHLIINGEIELFLSSTVFVLFSENKHATGGINSEVFMCLVVKGTSIAMIVPHLLWLILDLVLDVEDSLAVVLDGGKNKVFAATVSSGTTSKVEALAVLESGGVRLLIETCLGSVWFNATFEDIKLKGNIAIKWNWLSIIW
jgi:hypothetical protein